MVALATGLCFAACKKSTSTDKPKLKLKSVNAFEIRRNALLSITLECKNLDNLNTNQDTAVGVKFIVLNQAPCSGSPGLKSKILKFNLPETSTFSGTSEIIINWVNGSNGVGLPAGYGPLPITNCRPTDTTIIKFWVKSKAGVVSDTITLDKPIIIYNN